MSGDIFNTISIELRAVKKVKNINLYGWCSVYYTNVPPLWKFRSQDGDSRTLLGIFNTFKGTRCYDKRDKIFGLHGLARDCCREYVTIDYSKMTFEIAEAVLRHHRESHELPMDEMELMVLFFHFHSASEEAIEPLPQDYSNDTPEIRALSAGKRKSFIVYTSLCLDNGGLQSLAKHFLSPYEDRDSLIKCQRYLYCARDYWKSPEPTYATNVKGRSIEPHRMFDMEFENSKLPGDKLSVAWEALTGKRLRPQGYKTTVPVYINMLIDVVKQRPHWFKLPIHMMKICLDANGMLGIVPDEPAM